MKEDITYGYITRTNFNFYRRGRQVSGLKKALEEDKEVEMWKDWVKWKVEETEGPNQMSNS